MAENESPCQALEKENAQLKRRIAELEYGLHVANTRNQEYAEWKRWVLGTLSIPTKKASPAERIVAVVAREELERQDHLPDRGELSTVYMPNIAARAGMSAGTAGDTLTKLSHKGAYVREAYAVPTPSNGGPPSVRVAIAITPQFKAFPTKAILVEPEEERNHGGKRETCKHCGSAHLLKVTYVVCADCGAEVADSKKMLSVNLPMGDDLRIPLVDIFVPDIPTEEPPIEPSAEASTGPQQPAPVEPVAEPVGQIIHVEFESHAPICHLHSMEKVKMMSGRFLCPRCEPLRAIVRSG